MFFLQQNEVVMNNDKKYIVANWKMNGSIALLESWIDNIFNSAEKFGKIIDNEVVLCPPATLLDSASKLAKKYNANYQNLHLRIGAQNCHYGDSSAYTGDIGANLVKEFDTEFVIVGHAERRLYHDESNKNVSKKVDAIIKNEMMPIVCVGEDAKIRKSEKQLGFISDQVLACIPQDADFEKVIIAYEPIWAIGSGSSADFGDIEDMINHIKYTVAKNRNIDHNIVTVLYGGSVTESNSKEISQINEVDGFLVGSKSLDSRKFFEIILNTL